MQYIVRSVSFDERTTICRPILPRQELIQSNCCLWYDVKKRMSKFETQRDEMSWGIMDAEEGTENLYIPIIT